MRELKKVFCGSEERKERRRDLDSENLWWESRRGRRERRKEGEEERQGKRERESLWSERRVEGWEEREGEEIREYRRDGVRKEM